MNRLHELVFSNIRSSVVVIDADNHCIIDLNPAAARLIGLPPEEIIGRECHQFICPASKGKCPITDLGQIVDDSEKLLITANGQTIPIQKSVIPVTVEGKNLLIENFLDIRSLKESEQRFSHFLDYTYNWEYFLDAAGKIQYSSPSSERITGYLPGDFIRDPDLITNLVAEEDREMFQHHLEDYEKNPVLHDLEYRIITRSGKLRWIRHFCQPVFGPEGRFLGIRASNIDIDKRKQAEISLTKNETLLRSVYETAGVGMALLDPLGNFFKVNPSFCSMLGFTEEELLSGKFTIVHPEDRKASEIILQQLREGTVPNNVMEKRYICKDGRDIHVLHHASIIFDIFGFPYLFVIQAQDITALKEATRKAEESDLLKTSFLHNLSHEIRTPANAIQGFAELLKQPDLTMTEKEEYIGIIHQSVAQLMDILNDTVEISKLEINQVSLVYSVIDLNQLMDKVYQECRFKFASAVANLKNFSLELPPSSPRSFISDELRIKQILMCLLSNAFKFTRAGSVTMGYLVSRNIVQFFVRDTGIGIEPDKHSAIFEKFRQGEHTTTRIYGGLGLGLTIAKGLTEALGGKIRFNSIPGDGSTFFFSVPSLPDFSTSGGKLHALPSMQTQHDLSGKTILIAEDIDANFDYLKIALLRSQATVIRARNGLEAIVICRENPSIDLILMDVQMPEMNGYEATIEIRKFRPDLPVIAQTAYSIDFNKEEAFTAGCCDYLVKPISLQDLFTALESWISPEQAKQI